MRRRGKWGQGAITKRPNGRYQAQWSTTEGGKRVRKSATFELRNEAEWWLRQARRGSVPDTDITVAEYLERWLAGKRDIRPSTKALYESHVKVHLIPSLGTHRVTELAPRHVERFVDGLTAGQNRHGSPLEPGSAGSPLSPGTASLILRTLKAALQAGVDRRELPDNPAATVKPPYVSRKPVEAMTEAEAERILTSVEGTWIERIVRFLMGSGCRIGEACALDQGDVLDGYVRIRRPKGAPRATLVTEDGMAALREAIAHAPRVGPKEPVFFGPQTGDRLTRHPVTEAMKRLTGLSPHRLRHGLASLMAAKGWSMKVIAEQLGNTERVTASTYAHIAPEVSRAALDSVARRKQG